MLYQEYCDLFYDGFFKKIEKLDIPISYLKDLYENKKINLLFLKPEPLFVYKIAECCDNGYCNLIDNFWICNFKSGKPRIHYENVNDKNWGDLESFKGSHIIQIEEYKIKIEVRDNCCFIFEFDKTNQHSINVFYKLFEKYLKNAYIKFLISKRIEEIHDYEFQCIENIHNNMKNKKESL